MKNTPISDYLINIPKVELHVHIEGSFEPELVFDFAQRNNLDVEMRRPEAQNDADQKTIDRMCEKAIAIGLSPSKGDDGSVVIKFDTPEQLAKAYEFENLQEFLDIYYAGMKVLQTEEDFYDLTMAYLKKCRDQNIVHTEIFFDPQAHTERGISFDTVITGIHKALKDAKDKLGISAYLIMCYLRHLSEKDALNTWEQAQPHLDKIIGVGLDSSEMGFPPSKFQTVFAMAVQAGKKVVAHAGEEGPPDYVWQALDLLKVNRIDHGNRALEDKTLVDRIVAEKIPLTVCPLSNNKLQVVQDMGQHPLKKMLELGMKATINSDDPAYFGGYLIENFKVVQESLNLEIQDIYTLVKNSIDASFLPQQEKAQLHLNVDEFHHLFHKAC